MNLILIHRRNSCFPSSAKRVFLHRFISRRLTFISRNFTTFWAASVISQKYLHLFVIPLLVQQIKFHGNIFLSTETYNDCTHSLIAFVNESQISLLLQRHHVEFRSKHETRKTLLRNYANRENVYVYLDSWLA